MSTVSQTAKKLTPYLEKLRGVINYHSPEGFLDLPNDKKLVRDVLEVKKDKVSKSLKYIIVIGIGGSNLGAKAIYDALFGYADVLEPTRFPKMLFADTNDPESLEELKRFLRKTKRSKEILVNVISKSGETTETIANFEFILSALKKFKNIDERIVVTTDFGSKLYNLALEKGLTVLTVPHKVGGRYSVFSAVGLFPLSACGIDIKKLLAGAKRANKSCLQYKHNSAMISAAVIYLNLKRGKTIHDNFFFHPELESLGKWYRQLVSESLGKKRMAITPTVSVGSTDLHSIGQLYLAGPKDKLTTFISSQKFKPMPISKRRVFPALVSEIKGKSVATIMRAIFEGVKGAYRKRQLPFMEVILKDISAESLGEFMEFKMIETILLGKLLRVNAFNEPAVRLYKAYTRKYLKKR